MRVICPVCEAPGVPGDPADLCGRCRRKLEAANRAVSELAGDLEIAGDVDARESLLEALDGDQGAEVTISVRRSMLFRFVSSGS